MSMSNEALGIYLKLLCYDWMNDGIPNHEQTIMRLGGYNWFNFDGQERESSEYDLCFKMVMSRFIFHPEKGDNFITNKRLLKERQKQKDHIKEGSKSGKRGGGNPVFKAGSPNPYYPKDKDKGLDKGLDKAKINSSSSINNTNVLLKKDNTNVLSKKSKNEDKILESFNTLTGKKYHMTPGKRTQIDQRLKSFTYDELFCAIKNRLSDPSSMGKNVDGKVWAHDWDSLFRNDANVDRALNLAGTVVKDDKFYIAELNRLKIARFHGVHGLKILAKYIDFYVP